MKLDYAYIKEILSVIRDDDNHIIRSNVLAEKLGISLNKIDEQVFSKFVGHLRILYDEGCIDPSTPDLGFSQGANDHCIVCSARYRMTSRGYEFLDALSKQSVFDKIKDHSVSIAIEAGKQLLIEGLKKGIIG